jgi:predicted small metal-binding protein
MKYVIRCLELGRECDFVATGETPVEVKRAVWGHVRQDHGRLGLSPGMRAELDRQMDGLLGHQMVNDRPRWRRYRQ